VQYDGQTHVLKVTLPATDEITVELLVQRFQEQYKERFGLLLARHSCRVVTLRTSVVGTGHTFDLRRLGKPSVEPARTGTRPVYFLEAGWVDCPIYWRPNLAPGDKVQGPAVLEQPDSTVLMEPGDTAVVDECWNLVIELAPGR
jgi:N-methylhydantoinase A